MLKILMHQTKEYSRWFRAG